MSPSLVLAALAGVFHTALYVFLRGKADGRLPLLLLGACLGAWAGDALGGRLAPDVIRIGDFSVVGASIMAWVGILVVTVISVLGPSRKDNKAG